MSDFGPLQLASSTGASRDSTLTLQLEAVSALKVKRPKLGVPQALLSAPDDTVLFSTYDDFVTATRRLKADRALEDDLG